MHFELILTPAGRLRMQQGDDEKRATPDAWSLKAAGAFGSSQSEGLFALAASRPEAPPPPSFAFWRDFACRYLTQLCRIPECVGDRLDPIDAPAEAELSLMLLSAPPIHGAEYLSVEVFVDLWTQLDTWVRQQIAASKEGLTGKAQVNKPPVPRRPAAQTTPGTARSSRPVTGKVVARLRAKFAMSQGEFAKLLGVSAPTIGNWEKKTGRLALQARSLDAWEAVKQLTKQQARQKLDDA
jgi:DNA-binding XRE family transcriptional regulator